MKTRRVGIWLIGAWGGVATTAAVGLAALAKGLTPTTGMVTELPLCASLDLDAAAAFTVGGHDIHAGSFRESAYGLNERSGMFTARMLEGCSELLDVWSKNVKPGTVLQANATIRELGKQVKKAATPAEVVAAIQADLKAFRETHQLDQVVVVNVASTEPPFETGVEHQSSEWLKTTLNLPASGLYAFAAIDLGFAYVNFTPSFGASCEALEELAVARKVPLAGKDGKTGETLLKTVLAPMFAARNLNVLSWIGHNILGGGDGRVLNDPVNKASKVKSKDASLPAILGYKPQSLVSIEYVESLDDWKTAWDHVHFQGFLGTKMAFQFTWQGCDSILAAPLVIDLARLSLLAQRRGQAGTLADLACFFKSPAGTSEQDFFKQWRMFERFVGHGTS